MADTGAERDQLELLASDFLARLRRGESPSIADYAAAHPELAVDIRELFPTVRAAEQVKQPREERLPEDRVGVAADGEQPARTVRSESRLKREAAGSVADPDQAPTPHSGMALGKYTLVRCIGRGGLGSVWTAEHPEFGIPVAVKILHTSVSAASEEANQRFLREARAAARLNHPHIIRVFDAGVAEGLRYLVMEYVEGGTVAELQTATGGKLPIDQAVRILAATTEAVDAASQLGIVHRDIKPENILLDGNGQPKLADLGLAKETFAVEQHSVTHVGQIMGTPFYIAPEQAMGSPQVDVRTDIYSLGATLYHLVTGKPPFNGATLYDIFRGHLEKALVEPRQRNPEVPEDLSRIICRMMEKRPEDRYQTTAELRVDLARFAAGQKVAYRSRRPSWLSYAASVAAAALLLGIIYWAWPRQSGSEGQASLPATEASGVALPVAPAAGSPVPSAAAATGHGALAATNWEIVDGPLGVRGHFPGPLAPGDYQYEGETLQIEAKAETMRTLLHTTVPVLGTFRLLAEVRNINVIGIAGAPGEEGANCQAVLFSPSDPTVSDGRWHVVEFHRDRGPLACLVDGNPAYSLTGSQRAHGRIWLSIPSGTRSEIRRFELAAGTAMGLPRPSGGGLPLPRRR